MKKLKLLAICSVIAILLAGCGNKEPEWNEGTLGEINIDAEVVDQNDFDTEWEIDEYITFSEQNKSETPYTFDNYRLYYNKAADQLGLMLLREYEMTAESSQGESLTYQFSDYNTNNYLTIRDGKVTRVQFEHSGDYSNEKVYKTCIAECMPAIYGGVPFLKKYDLNHIFQELCQSLQEEKSTYITEFNGISISVKRNYNLVTIYIAKAAKN